MKKLIFFMLVLFAFNISPAQIQLERIKVTEDISMKIPAGFTPMSEAELIQKYVSARKPIAMFTSQDRQADLGINENSSTWVGDDLEILQSFYKANIANLFTEVKFIQDDIQEIGDRKFAVFEFVSKVSYEENTFGGGGSVSKYNYLMYTIKDDNVLLFNFSSPTRQQAQWQETVRQMMESVRIK